MHKICIKQNCMFWNPGS